LAKPISQAIHRRAIDLDLHGVWSQRAGKERQPIVILCRPEGSFHGVFRSPIAAIPGIAADRSDQGVGPGIAILREGDALESEHASASIRENRYRSPSPVEVLHGFAFSLRLCSRHESYTVRVDLRTSLPRARPYSGKSRLGRPIASGASECASEKQVKMPWEMQAVLGRRILFMVNYGLFLTNSLSRDMSHPLALA